MTMIRIRDVYDVLGLPNGLRTHMVRTIAVVETIGGDGDGLPAEEVRDVALAMALHDVGNVVRPIGDGSLLGEPKKSLDRWRLYSAFTRALYGSDPHRATARILNDLGVKQRLINLIDRKSSSNLSSILELGRKDELLALYADMRVSPTGLVSLAERHRDAVARYAGDPERRGLGGDVTLQQLRELEDEVANRFGFDVTSLQPEDIDRRLQSYSEMDFANAFN